MATPFIGEIRLFAGNFAPAGWNLCDGSTLQISDYDTLYTLIGTTYGGDGQSTFRVPDLRGRLPMHYGRNATGVHVIGETGGAETAALTLAQIPAHTHALNASTDAASSGSPLNNVPATTTAAKTFSNEAAPLLRAMNAAFLAPQGTSSPHGNLQPFVALTFIIALQGVFPSQ